MQQPHLRLRVDRLRAAMIWACVHTPSNLATTAGVSLQTAHRWLSGESTQIGLDNLFSLADGLDVSVRWLLGDDCPPGRPLILTPDERLLVDLYRSATPHMREWLLHIASLSEDATGR